MNMNRHIKYSLTVGLALTVLLISLTLPAVGDVETGFINGVVQANGKTMPYVVYVPRNYTPEKQWPVILFLHGAGEVGTDGFRQVLVGIGQQLMVNPKRFPCLVVMSQLPSGAAWSGSWNDLALQALEAVVEKYGGDRNRLYLTGLSLGGNGTWTIVSKHPELFAAAMPIAGWVDNPVTVAPALQSLPLWVFHGSADPIVSPVSDRNLVKLITAEGNPNIQYTEYPGAGHNVWDMAYGNNKVIVWLLAQHR